MQESANKGRVPPQKVRHFCYEVALRLAEESPQLDMIFPRLRDASFEATNEALLSCLSASDAWRDRLPGLKDASLSGGNREVKFELLDVMAAMSAKGYTLANTWNALLELVESKVVRLEIFKERFGLTPRAKQAMACETDSVEYSTGRIVLRMSFRKFQRYLSGREAKGLVETPSEEPKPRRVSKRTIPPKLQTRRMTLSEAAHLMYHKGNRRKNTNKLKACMTDGVISFIKKNRQSYIFSKEDFPPEAWDKLR